MILRNATLLRLEGRAVLQLDTDRGVAYVDSPKEAFLSRHFVPLSGPDVESGKVESETSYMPPNPADGRWQPLAIEHTTTDTVVLFLARRLARGELAEGTVVIPEFTEADADAA